MKNVLLLVHDDDGQEARLQAALDVARSVEGHLTCVHVTEYSPIVGDAFGMSGAVTLLELERVAETDNRARIEERLAKEDVSFDWLEFTGDPLAALDKVDELADLIVVNSEFAQSSHPGIRKLSERFVTKTSAPLLAVPDAKGFRPTEPALIAWDGTDPCAAAVKAAVPLLALSESVTILEIDDESIGAPAETVAAYLSRHGIHAEILRQKVPGREYIEPILLAKLEVGGFGWVVMGAFSKSRMHESLFGGVTKRLLKESPIPLVIAH